MFEDEAKEEKSEIEILNDDEGNDNDYLQFFSNPIKIKNPPFLMIQNLPNQQE